MAINDNTFKDFAKKNKSIIDDNTFKDFTTPTDERLIPSEDRLRANLKPIIDDNTFKDFTIPTTEKLIPSEDRLRANLIPFEQLTSEQKEGLGRDRSLEEPEQKVTDFSAKELALRAGKEFANKFALDLAEKSRPSSNTVEAFSVMSDVMDKTKDLPFETLGEKLKAVPSLWWAITSSALGIKSKTKKDLAVAQLKDLRPGIDFEVPEPERDAEGKLTKRGIAEKSIDVTAGLGAIVSQILITKKLIPSGTILSDAVAFEMINRAEGGIPGKGAMTAGALGLIGQIPSAAAAGKVGKVALQSGLFGGITAASGGSTEDIIISALVPVLLAPVHGKIQKNKITNVRKQLNKQVTNKFNSRDLQIKKKLSDLTKQEHGTAEQQSARRQQMQQLRSESQAITRLANSELQKVDQIVSLFEAEIKSSREFGGSSLSADQLIKLFNKHGFKVGANTKTAKELSKVTGDPRFLKGQGKRPVPESDPFTTKEQIISKIKSPIKSIKEGIKDIKESLPPPSIEQLGGKPGKPISPEARQIPIIPVAPKAVTTGTTITAPTEVTPTEAIEAAPTEVAEISQQDTRQNRQDRIANKKQEPTDIEKIREKRKKETAEIFTPIELVNDMVGKLQEVGPENFTDADATFIDPAAGNGNFLVNVLVRKLIEGADPTKSLNSIFGVELMGDNVREMRIRMLKVLNQFTDITDEHIKIVMNNIRTGDALKTKTDKINKKTGKRTYDPKGESIIINKLGDKNWTEKNINDWSKNLNEWMKEVDTIDIEIMLEDAIDKGLDIASLKKPTIAPPQEPPTTPPVAEGFEEPDPDKIKFIIDTKKKLTDARNILADKGASQEQRFNAGDSVSEAIESIQEQLSDDKQAQTELNLILDKVREIGPLQNIDSIGRVLDRAGDRITKEDLTLEEMQAQMKRSEEDKARDRITALSEEVRISSKKRREETKRLKAEKVKSKKLLREKIKSKQAKIKESKIEEAKKKIQARKITDRKLKSVKALDIINKNQQKIEDISSELIDFKQENITKENTKLVINLINIIEDTQKAANEPSLISKEVKNNIKNNMLDSIGEKVPAQVLKFVDMITKKVRRDYKIVTLAQSAGNFIKKLKEENIKLDLENKLDKKINKFIKEAKNKKEFEFNTSSLSNIFKDIKQDLLNRFGEDYANDIIPESVFNILAGNNSLDDLTLDQMEDVTGEIDRLTNYIIKKDKIFVEVGDDRNRQVIPITEAREIIDRESQSLKKKNKKELDEIKKPRTRFGKGYKSLKEIISNLSNTFTGIDNLTPHFLVERLSGWKMGSLTTRIADTNMLLGTHKQNSLKKSLIMRFNEALFEGNRENLKPQDRENTGIDKITLEEAGNITDQLTGKTKIYKIKLGEKRKILNVSGGELIHYYLTSKRAKGRRHLSRNGIRFEKILTGKFSKEDFDKIKNIVENDQALKSSADTISYFYNHESKSNNVKKISIKDGINITSQTSDGYDKAKDKKYYPIETYSDPKLIGKQVNTSLLEDANFLQKVTAGTQPIVSRDAFAVFLSSIDSVSEYYGFAAPLRSLKFLLNDEKWKNNVNERGYRREREAMITIFSNAEKSINKSKVAVFINSLQGKLARGILNLNIGVVALQPGSIFNYKAKTDVSILKSVMKKHDIGNKEKRKNFLNRQFKEMIEHTPFFYDRWVLGHMNIELAEAGKTDAVNKAFKGESIGFNKAGIFLKSTDFLGLSAGWSISKTEINKDKLFNESAEWWEDWENRNNKKRGDLTRGSDEWWDAVIERAEFLWVTTQPTFDKVNRTANTSARDDPARLVFFIFRGFWDKAFGNMKNQFARIKLTKEKGRVGRALRNFAWLWAGVSLFSMLKDIVRILLGDEKEWDSILFDAGTAPLNTLPFIGGKIQKGIKIPLQKAFNRKPDRFFGTSTLYQGLIDRVLRNLLKITKGTAEGIREEDWDIIIQKALIPGAVETLKINALLLGLNPADLERLTESYASTLGLDLEEFEDQLGIKVKDPSLLKRIGLDGKTREELRKEQLKARTGSRDKLRKKRSDLRKRRER